MGKKKNTPKKGEQPSNPTESGLCIFKKGDQIKTLTDKRWNVYSGNVEARWYEVSFNGIMPKIIPYAT